MKESIMLHSIRKNIKNNPFDVHEIENYSLPDDASRLDTNSYYFSSHDLDGNSLLIRYAERGDNSTEVWFVLKYKQQIYMNKQQVFTKETTPVCVRCLTPGKTWEVTYQGDVYKSSIHEDLTVSPNKTPKKLSLTLTFQATKNIFDFSYHINPKVLAKSLAKETWDKSFIANMRENQQRHYEQQGNVTVTMTIDKKPITLHMRAMRDHSFGRRDWNYMNRHIWLMALIGGNESLNVNMVSYPHMKDLRTGYHETKHRTSTVSKVSNLFQIETNADVPNHVTYDVTLDNGETLKILATKEVVINFPFDNGAYTICEGIGTFEVNGKKGRGIMEFGYHKDDQRWK